MSERKTAVVLRFGGYGDVVWSTSVVRALKDQGYYVVLHTNEPGRQVFQNDPNVGEIWVHPSVVSNERREVVVPKSAKIVDLSGSDDRIVEGKYRWGCAIHPLCYHIGCHYCEDAKQARDARLRDLNHEDEVAGGDMGLYRPQMYFTPTELEDANKTATEWSGKYSVVWCSATSVEHKVYPHWFDAMSEFTRRHDDTVVYSVGIERNPFNFAGERIVPIHDWSFRKSALMCSMASLVVGCEGALLAACGHYPVPKIVILSVSSPTNVAKHWQNAVCISPEVPCHPCHQMHPTGTCPTELVMRENPRFRHEWPICMARLKPEVLVEAMEKEYQKATAAYSQPIESVNGEEYGRRGVEPAVLARLQ